MEKMENIKLENIKDYSDKETVVKSWELSVKKKLDNKEKVVMSNKITLTEQRLIISEQKSNRTSQNYKKSSYPIEDIKSTYVQMGSDFEQKPLLPLVVLICLTLTFLIAGICMFSSVLALGFVFLIFFILCLAKTLSSILDFRTQTSACIVIKLELEKNSVSKTIVKSYTNVSGVSQSKESAVILKFKVTADAVEMAKELDNLIIATQIKNGIKK